MSFTLSNCIERINQILNYPSLTYDDVSSFFDQAIAELNTSLHIGLRTISECIKIKQNSSISSQPNMIVLSSVAESETPIASAATVPETAPKIYYDTTKKQYGIKQTDNTYYYSNTAYAYLNTYTIDGVTIFKAVKYADNVINWALSDSENPLSLDLSDFLTSDWIILFVIPYVCFKYAVRDGDSGALYSEEFSQGFQQLQQSYNVPSFVLLATCAHLPAYKPDVEAHLEDASLNIKIPTRAITELMKSDAIVSVVRDDFYNSNGWGF